jgi:hypothetical protein
LERVTERREREREREREGKRSKRTIALRAILKNHVNPGTFGVGATDILAGVVVFTISAYTTNPKNVG